MSRETQASESITIDADAATVYDLISDPENFGRWSPENTGATVIDGDLADLQVGSTFWGHNRRGPMRWATFCRVVAADPGREFAFEVLGQRIGGKERPRLPFEIATWRYQLEAVEGGTKVTETWRDDRESTLFGRLSRTSDRLVTGGPTFAELHRRNMRQTLGQLKDEVESATAS